MASKDCGILLVDKPAGVTSHDVVFRLRRELGVKTGHAGTLDPFATGLLVVLLGRATRLQRYLLHQRKTYIATARLGWRSTTGDRDGDLVESGRVPADPQLPVGTLALAVPAFSAIKVSGERLYAKARRGEEFTPPVREMTVYRAERMSLTAQTATFEIECASGTYVRSLVSTLEDAYCDELVRTHVGQLRLADADSEHIVEPIEALGHMPAVALDDESALAVAHGKKRPAGDRALDAVAESLAGDSAGRIRLVNRGRLIGVAYVADGLLRPETMLAGSPAELEQLA